MIFLDSGAFSIYWQKVYPKGNDYSFYDTKEFWTYVDTYAEFMKKWAKDIPLYANCDAIYNPERSWEVLKYLENEHGLSPVPVIHTNTPIKWVEKHVEAGYEYLGIGGMGNPATSAGTKKEKYKKWADKVFEVLCPGPSYLPVLKPHGFGITSQELLLRYPWWSVDSTAWAKRAGYGKIYVPHYRKGAFVFSDVKDASYDLFIGFDSSYKKDKGRHFENISSLHQEIVKTWLKEIDVPLGKVDSEGNILEAGVTTSYDFRCLANLLFLERLRLSLPDWPWPFRQLPKGLF